MKKIIYLFLFSIISTNTIACNYSSKDKWHGNDKIKHYGISTGFGALGSYLAKDTSHPILYGTIIGATPGLIKEISDSCRHNGSGFSSKDMAFNILGAFTGAYLGNMAITYSSNHNSNKQLVVNYYKEF